MVSTSPFDILVPFMKENYFIFPMDCNMRTV